MILNEELFVNIAQALIDDYVRVYRVNINTNEYCQYYVAQESHSFSEAQKGDDFFSDLAGAIGQVVYEEDEHIFRTKDIKEKLIKQLRDGRNYSFVYRLMVNGKPTYHTMRLIYEYVDGDEYFIIGVIDVDKTVRKQKDVDEKAHIDILTGAWNTNAYQEWEEEYQLLIEQHKDLQFGMVVCDVNNLKIINDTMGHKAGDEMLQSAYTLLCNTFAHSMVYRVGGDEFVVVLDGVDYEKRVELFNGLRETVINNQNNNEGIVLATGMSIYIKETDKNLSDVFQRADEEMYADKGSLKENAARINKSQESNEKIEKVPAIRKARLDSFFKVFKMAAGKGNIFFCDIRYDFSRWDKQVVDNYGLPSEYMYNAGGIWEERIHPSDRQNYNKSVEMAFDGGKDEFELSYRVKENSGNYVPCTCKGLVVRNQHGEPEYFGGALFIREGDTKPKIP